ECPILTRLRQPVESEIDVSQRELDDCEFERRHVTALREPFELPENLERCVALDGQRQRARERGVHARRLRRQMNRTLKRGRRFVEVLSLFLDESKREV